MHRGSSGSIESSRRGGQENPSLRPRDRVRIRLLKGGAAMRRDIVWERLDQPGLEHLSLDIRPDGIDADGLVLVDPGAGVVAKLPSAVRCDDRWRTTGAAFAVDLGNDHRTAERIGTAAGREKG